MRIWFAGSTCDLEQSMDRKAPFPLGVLLLDLSFCTSRLRKQRLFALAYLLFVVAFGHAQTELDDFIVERMNIHHISGLSACLVQDGDVLWYRNFGLANREAQTPVDTNTIFLLASVSKTITGTALMQLYEDGHFELDDPINNVLPFDVLHPAHPDVAITFRQVLTHTSGIRDNWNLLPYYDGDAPVALGDFLFDYLSEAGDDYNAAQNFYNYAPGTDANYCNVAVALCGYLVEVIAEQPFNEYCNEHIFEPLCMEHTGWFLSEVDQSLIARPYSFLGGNYLDNGLYGYADYPDGQLRTTSLALARFMYAHMNDGHFDGYQMLEPETVSLMRSQVVSDIDPTQGIIFYYYLENGQQWWGHSGGDAGVSTSMYFNEANDLGLIILTNSDGNHSSIWNGILEYVDQMLPELAAPVACDISIPVQTTDIELPQVAIFPNPATDYLTLSIGVPLAEGMVEIHDLMGKRVATMPLARSIQVSDLPAGAYQLRVISSEVVTQGAVFLKR